MPVLPRQGRAGAAVAGASLGTLAFEDSKMTILKRPQRANGNARPKLGLVDSILAQSKVVADAFGRGLGFILMMTALFVVLGASLT